MRQIAEHAQVSTRTLYNQYKDKGSLFEACLEFGSSAFPRIDSRTGGDAETDLRRFAVDLIRMLSAETSESLSLLVSREGAEFPELVRASERNQQQYLVLPLASYLRDCGLATGDEEPAAKILLAMILAGWQRRLAFGSPALSEVDLHQHADLAVRLFLTGAKAARGRTLSAGRHNKQVVGEIE